MHRRIQRAIAWTAWREIRLTLINEIHIPHYVHWIDRAIAVPVAVRARRSKTLGLDEVGTPPTARLGRQAGVSTPFFQFSDYWNDRKEMSKPSPAGGGAKGFDLPAFEFVRARLAQAGIHA